VHSPRTRALSRSRLSGATRCNSGSRFSQRAARRRGYSGCIWRRYSWSARPPIAGSKRPRNATIRGWAAAGVRAPARIDAASCGLLRARAPNSETRHCERSEAIQPWGHVAAQAGAAAARRATLVCAATTPGRHTIPSGAAGAPLARVGRGPSCN
jgi:hypothetical protein